jgi:uncharacterized membrane protein YccC
LVRLLIYIYVTGGTLCKGLNRAFGTLVAGFIAVGAHKVAYLCGDKAEPVLLAIFVFLLCTYALCPCTVYYNCAVYLHIEHDHFYQMYTACMHAHVLLCQ